MSGAAAAAAAGAAVATVLLLALATTCAASSSATAVKDVLFIAVDDLRPSLSIYGDPAIKTPNLAALAARSMVFDRMYTAVSVCAPARTAIMVGRRPDTTHNWMISGREYWRDVLPSASSLPQYFLQHGYKTLGGGKIFHPGEGSCGQPLGPTANRPPHPAAPRPSALARALQHTAAAERVTVPTGDRRRLGKR
eukprot:SAG31_NODE_3902_length_3768_cov_5.032979_5_plen_194_part_00